MIEEDLLGEHQEEATASTEALDAAAPYNQSLTLHVPATKS